jgi:thiol-disulfide isomerase/thioredoxin
MKIVMFSQAFVIFNFNRIISDCSMTQYIRLIFCLIFVLSGPSLILAQGYQIKVKIKGFSKDSSVFLGHYYFGNQQIILKDTAKADSEGNLVFEGKKDLPEGLYVLTRSKSVPITDIIVIQQKFSLETDTTNIVRNMKVVGSAENEIFFGHQQKMAELYEQFRVLRLEYNTRKDQITMMKIRQLQQKILTQQRAFIKEKQGTFVAKLINASLEPEVVPAPKLPNGKPDSVFVINQYKKSLLDRIDWADERMGRSPFVEKTIERYFSELVIQDPDSLIVEGDKLIARTKNTRDMRRYVIYKLAATYESPTILGTDAFFVHLAEKYYAGEATLWDSVSVRRLSERANILKPLLVKRPFPNSVLTDSTGRTKSFNDIKANYTVVYFYSPDCGHCRDSAPKLVETHSKIQALGAEIVAVPVYRDKETWMKFVREFKMQKLVNLYDSYSVVDFKNKYDTQTTPMVYVLDKDKKIIARRLPTDKIEDFLNFIEKNKHK